MIIRQKVNDGDVVTLTGTLKTVHFKHPNGDDLTNLTFNVKTPIELKGEETVHKNCKSLVILNSKSLNLPEEGKEITIKGTIKETPPTAYYLYNCWFEIDSIIDTQLSTINNHTYTVYDDSSINTWEEAEKSCENKGTLGDYNIQRRK